MSKTKQEERISAIREAIKKTLYGGITADGISGQIPKARLVLAWNLSRTNALLAILPHCGEKAIARISPNVVRVRKDTTYKDLFVEYAERTSKRVIEVDEFYDTGSTMGSPFDLANIGLRGNV